VSQILSKVLLLCLTLTSVCGLVSAEENRYRSWIDDRNVLHRFDNVSGDIEMLVKPASGPAMWVRCEVAQAKPAQKVAQQQHVEFPAAPNYVAPAPMPQPINTSSRNPGAIIDGQTETMATPLPDLPRRAPGAGPKFEDDTGRDISDDVNDADRTLSRMAIAGYDRKLSLINTIRVANDRITGSIMLENKGERHIKVLELTMFVRTVGKDGVLPHARFLYSPKTNLKPPQPGDPISVMQKVDLPQPTGVISGSPEIKVTYIKFED
jgi:hypothetical protein